MDNNGLTETLAQRKKDKPKIYREIADEAKAAMIASDVAFKRKNLAMVTRVDLNDLDAVKARTDAFLASCEAASVLPTFLGLCIAYGYTREGIYKYLRNNNHTQVAQYIEIVRETVADVMINAGLTRTTDNATTIFALKNLHGFSDKLQVEAVPVQPDPLGERPTIEQLAAQLDALPDDDFDNFGE